jgi:hypothetical protein
MTEGLLRLPREDIGTRLYGGSVAVRPQLPQKTVPRTHSFPRACSTNAEAGHGLRD